MAELNQIIENYNVAKEKSEEYKLGFNVFSLMSDTYYKENFHSEIIHSFLNENKHKEAKMFLEEFVVYFLGKDKVCYYQEAKADNEKGINGKRRIDLLISSKTNAIIIENKVNNAIDMDNQLIDYYKYCKAKKLEVDKIFYLSKNGYKTPDKGKWEDSGVTKEVEALLKPLAVYSNDINSLTIYGWLEVCKEKTQNEDTRFLVKQYQQLLKYLRGFVLENEVLEKYFQFLSASEENKVKAEADMGKTKAINADLYKYYGYRLIEMIEKREQIYSRKRFSDAVHFSGVDAIFRNIGNDREHYLKIGFSDTDSLNNGRYSIRLMDNSQKFKHNGALEREERFTKKFVKRSERGTKYWEIKKTESQYNLITEFDKFVEYIDEVLNLVSNILYEENQKRK